MNRKEVPTQYPDIKKILVQDAQGRWGEPTRGKKYKARRYQKNADGTVERIKRSFESLAEAKVFRLGKQFQEEISKPPVGKSSDMTFQVLVELWSTNWLPCVDLSTQLKYRRYLKHLTFFSEKSVASIQPGDIDAWIAYVKHPEYLASCHSTRLSYQHEFKTLRSILNYFSSRIDRSYRSPILRDHLKMLKVKEAPRFRKDLTIGQFEAFMEELRALCWDTKWESIYYLALMQYAIYGRIQEVAALFAEDFDLDNNRLEIKRKIQWLRAKGYENRIVDGLKAGGGKIFSPIPELALKVLNEWKLRSGVRTGLLFRIDGQAIEYRQIQYKYDQALRKAKLPFSSTHVIRHAALTEAYSTTANILAVQKLAGHSSLKATERYAKARDEQIVEVQRRMDAKLVSILPSK